MPTLMLELASASPPNPLQRLACLCARTPSLTTPYASTPPPLTIFTLLMLPHPRLTILTLLQGPQVMSLTPPSPPCLPSIHSYSALPTCP
ncbi:hypothetical protein O181_070147 [Austropuccinia psidii MF-1]|uniref:Uncharacterized protein n=1 Tax=Austropuccinia psidii MF-1 TaxID=1389203 RepID=A0A9Q3F5E4_9BASI|nr:hypothetical protein [Austropuccinia psidii MF-1]